MEKIILTGFMPFGNYKFNPTEQSTIDFDGKVFGDRQVIGLVLPCIYDAWGHLASLIQRTNPYAVISTGLSSSVRGMRIESTFRNIMESKYADADGYAPENVPIMSGNVPNTIHSRAPHKKLFSILIENGIPAERSTNADTFICNALGYKTSLSTQSSMYNARNLFIHIPWTSDYKERVSIESGKNFLDHDLYYRGLELLIRNI